ncbi:hypothetical protein KJ359_005090 [Pestalotiopsis sp. 9143b]|nr:hypothetical protein KJ359_005090 [Pestalotiopsis sp. 9143b]
MASMSTFSIQDDSQEDDPKSTILRLPDLFSSITSAEAPVNPLYSKVKVDADAWAVNTLQLDGDEATRNARADMAYLSATWVPRADAAGLRLMTDWNHWVFAFDDIFDEGVLKDDTLGAAQTIIASLAVLDDTHPAVSAEQDPILLIYGNDLLSLRKDMLNMPASDDKAFYEMLDSIANTGEEDAVQQNKRIKEAEFAADSAEPNEEQIAAIDRELEASRHQAAAQKHENS